MMVFWVVAALLMAAALLFVLPPLIFGASNKDVIERNTLNISIYRDQLDDLERDLKNDVITTEQYEQGRVELERRMLEDVPDTHGENLHAHPTQKKGTLAAVIVGIAVPAFAIGIYQWLGTPSAISPQDNLAATTGAAATTPDGMADQINAMVTQLAQRLEENPADAEGWAMLGRSYLVLERLDDAVAAYEKAVALSNNNPNLLVDYADALAMAGGEQSLEGRPMELIEQALSLDPNNQKALWLAGTAAYEKAEFKQALDHWRRLYEMLPKDSEDARIMQGNIKEAEALLAGRSNATSGKGNDVPVAQNNDKPAGNVQNSRRISGVATLDKKLAGKVSDTDTVFVFARASAGPRMPLAVMRAQVKDLPLDFSLDDSMAINPSMTISKFPEIVVIARISKSGNATPQSGDIQGMSKTLPVGSDKAEVLMNEVIP